jgi:asparagine synthase (glutamine-hydrolysing)
VCGIVVAVSPRQPTRVATIVAMTRALRHRGPDGEGYAVFDGQRMLRLWGAETPEAVRHVPSPSRPESDAEDQPERGGALLMGHRRLAIVDLSPFGHQPMQRGDLHVVFNGEIYNHVELRDELQALGHAFVSHSDTEVLLAAYEAWGADAWSRMNGMWAFAIFDARKRRLVIGRDRFGVKPLYLWTGDDGELLLASEIKALLVHPRVRAEADVDSCVRFAANGPRVWENGTVFSGIQRFPAGHWAEVEIDAPTPLHPRRYWDAPEADALALAMPFDARIAQRLAERYRELLDDAVRLRMRMDVRFGTALSGGLDSSQIAACVNTELQRRGAHEQQEVFSSVYPRTAGGASCGVDESYFVDRMSAYLAVRSNKIEPLGQDVPSAHERLIWALDSPPVNSLMSSWHTYALVARRGVVVTLDGQGADEQLAGYTRYLRNALAHSNSPLREARALLRNASGSGRLVGVGLLARLLRGGLGDVAFAHLCERISRARDLPMTVPQALARDFATDLQNLLHYADQAAMGWSVESRMPFMDWRMVEFLASVPVAYKLHDGWTKWLAREAMGQRLPPEITWRRDKIGWAIPEATWFAPGGPMAAWFEATLKGSAFACETARSASIDIVAAPMATRLRLLNLAVWHRLFFEEDGRPGRPLGRNQPAGA